MSTILLSTVPIIGQHFIKNLQTPEEKFFFKHDKKNVHDAYGVLAVNKNGDSVGWVPKELSPMIVYLLKKKFGTVVNDRCRLFMLSGANNFVCNVWVA